ncbi:hypothetical protein CDD81_4826 [Ophiocordyceps australis]|uniref:Zn(2)-C6 fungal-type domain-containing protein n=1 Tax=Ophiocordyceps australis TaxID=1399860 RepID=A0A2C5YAC7_9HYPO|nr:hypothetical protein CDD81_4826 [Ophiocordyceps australis]
MADSTSRSGLPMGFSVFQPAPGAQLEFSPPLGTRQLDGLVHAYIPGPAPIMEKRASISVDFLYCLRQTGQVYKFYAVSPPASATSMSTSPSSDSSCSSPLDTCVGHLSANTSPVAGSWDWSATASLSSRSSPSSQRARRPGAKTSTWPSRHQTRDYSHLPGMKILTKDGRDVTNSASRGCKTKEQRDHAHLMRIIKACSDCRRKKIRCDPSHKKRGADAARPPATRVGVRKKEKDVAQSQPCLRQRQTALQTQQSLGTEAASPSSRLDFLVPTSSLDCDFDFSLPGFDSADENQQSCSTDSWEQFIEYPPADFIPDVDLDMFINNSPLADFQGHSACLDWGSNSSSLGLESNSPPMSYPYMSPPLSSAAFAPPHSLDPSAPPGSSANNGLCNALLPYDAPGGVGMDYKDFNLYSPRSSFSEDDNMLSIGSWRDKCPRPDLLGVQDESSRVQLAQPLASSASRSSSDNGDAREMLHAALVAKQQQLARQHAVLSSVVFTSSGALDCPLSAAAAPPLHGHDGGVEQGTNTSADAMSLGATSRSLADALQRPAESALLHGQPYNAHHDLARMPYHLHATCTTLSSLPCLKDRLQHVSRPSHVTDSCLVRLASPSDAQENTASCSSEQPLVRGLVDATLRCRRLVSTTGSSLDEQACVSTNALGWRQWPQDDGTVAVVASTPRAPCWSTQHPPQPASSVAPTSSAATPAQPQLGLLDTAVAHGNALRQLCTAGQATTKLRTPAMGKLRRAVNVVLALSGFASLLLAHGLCAAPPACSVYVLGAVLVLVTRVANAASRVRAVSTGQASRVLCEVSKRDGGQAACRAAWVTCWRSVAST